MILPDHQIRAAIEEGRLGVQPYDLSMIQPASLDVRLDPRFRVFSNHRYESIDPAAEMSELTELVEIPEGEFFVLHPGQMVLGSTLEVITIPDDLVAELKGKSSLARLGLYVESAGWVDPGFSGQVTLELSNAANLPIRLYPGMKISQITLAQLAAPVETPYGAGKLGSKYSGQMGPTPSESWRNFRRED